MLQYCFTPSHIFWGSILKRFCQWKVILKVRAVDSIQGIDAYHSDCACSHALEVGRGLLILLMCVTDF
jgi:hypothetical protein